MEFEAVSLASIKFILLPDQQEMYFSSHVLNRQSSIVKKNVIRTRQNCASTICSNCSFCIINLFCQEIRDRDNHTT